ncbi:uncharacterized protein LOC5575405 [Aedes aegypti]|uniref:Uncharacterized protein n=1 Tax=Aedes aegypti TaxID=7159 RepID=A0A6I8TMW0_AEDAE|nr:uncharacterized protein LOC5575405 [Aedes aegypti]XP_021704591.1 uncharacterized protein LOC5575405 [Aedes aegypti]
MAPTTEIEDSGSRDDCTEQPESFEDTSRTSGSMGSTTSERESERCLVVQSPLSSTASSGIGASSSFSVINYVGKAQKQSSHRSSVVRSRTPYDRQTPAQPSRVESIDETTCSSIASSVDCCSMVADSVSVEDVNDMAELDDCSRSSSDQQALAQQQLQLAQPRIHHGPRSHRSMSVSSSGCSSSMDERNCDFSSLDSCRCTSLGISDFDDDGFREDGSVSSMYSVFSSPRPYHLHHQLHHNHQNVPRHPNNTKGLFDIALKTVKLIRRNQELQMRLAQLQRETNAFIESVMANPENESLRNHIHAGGAIRAVTPGVVVQK